MALSVDTNIIVHALNADSEAHAPARAFLDSLATRTDVVIAEQMLVEVYLLIRNKAVFRRPYSAPDAVAVCRRLRSNPRWRVVECRPVMSKVWTQASTSGFARRRIIDLRLAYTLTAAGVTEFATGNVEHFRGLGFERVFDPTV